MKTKAIFFGDPGQITFVYSEATVKKLKERFDFLGDGKTYVKKELPACPETKEAEFLFSTWGMASFTEEELASLLPSLRAVFYGAGSVQAFAREFLHRGIAVVSAWAANGVPVAEYTFSAVMLAATGFFGRVHIPGTGNAGSDGWTNRYPGVSWPGNYETKIGIIGAGMIGKMVIERLKTLSRAEILVYDRFLSEEKAEQLGVRKCDLPTLFEESDVISNHLANNPQTVGMLTGELFARMKPTATFINTGRGAQVDEAGLIRALTEVPTRCAVLDVTWPEPPELGSPFYALKNVFLTPHIAGSLGNEVHRMGEYMLEEAVAFDEGRELRYGVTEKMLETMA